MTRKECESKLFRRHRAVLAVCSALYWCAPTAATETIHLSRSVVVTGTQITLGQICRVSELNSVGQTAWEGAIVKSAPVAGESVWVTTEEVERALQRNGINVANVVLRGATKCEVSRSLQLPTSVTPGVLDNDPDGVAIATPSSGGGKDAEAELLDQVRRAFAERLGRYGGRSEIRVGLCGEAAFVRPEREYTTVIRVRGDRWIGRMIKAEVDVFVGAERVESVPVVVSATVTKQVVVARRTINMKAKVQREDLTTAERTYDAADEIPTATMDTVVGRQAKRVIAVGQSLGLTDVETVPVIKRGEIVDVFSLAGGVEVRSAGRAMDSGGIGDVIGIQTGARRGDRLSAVVTGERQVRIAGGDGAGQGSDVRLALGEGDDR